MSDEDQRAKELRRHLSDLQALQEHVLDAIRRQSEDERLANHSKAEHIVSKVRSTLERHEESLKRELDRLGDSKQSQVKSAITEVAGQVAGLYDKVRDHNVSRNLRDDYAALGLIAAAYTLLNATALAMEDEAIANLASQHLKETTPLIVEISESLPHVVTAELEEEFPRMELDQAAASVSVDQTQAAWSAINTEMNQ